MSYGNSVIDNVIESEIIQKDYNNNLYQKFQKKISYIPGLTYQDKLDFLNLCYCCPRHTIDRPNILQIWYELPPNYIRNTRSKCKCKCRHNARNICRYISGSVQYN